MRIGPIKQRLLDQVPAFASVSGAAAMAAAMQSGHFSHSAYVFVSSVTGQDNQLINQISQRVPIEVTVAYWVRNVSDGTGEAAADDTEDLRVAVLDALLGFIPPDEKTPLFYRGGGVINFSFGTVLWADKYLINTTVRRT
jgi:hypothetical protein